MKMKRILSSILAVAMVATIVTGCGSDSSSEGSTTSAANDTLTYAQGADPRGLDPALVDDNESAKVTVQMYEGLLNYEDDSTEVKPCLAESWEISDDGLTYTFKLRKGVKFHDGTDFNAEAVKFNIDRLTVNKTDDMPYADFCFGYVKETKVVDDSTVQIILKDKYTPFLANIAMCMAAPIVSPTACEKNGGNLMEKPCGTGPYKFVSWNKNQDVILVRNDDYWGEKAKIKNLVIKTIADGSARATALETGEVDIIDGIDTTLVKRLSDNENLKVNLDEGMNINYLAYNTTADATKDKDVRVALSQAINLDELVESLYQGYATKATTILPSFLPGYSDTVKQVSYDKEAAEKTLKEKGITKLKMITYTNPRPYNTATGQILATTIQGYLKEVGVDVTIDSYDWTTYKDKIIAGDYDICFYGWNGDNGDADNFLNLLSDKDVSMNVARYNDKTYNELIAKGAQTPAGDERNAVYAECEQYVADEAIWLPISHQQNITANAANVKNFRYHPTAVVFLSTVTKG